MLQLQFDRATLLADPVRLPDGLERTFEQLGIAGHSSLAANPRAQPPFSLWGRGVAGDWALADSGGIDFSALTKVEVGFMSQALSGQAVAVSTAGALRTLKPLPGWPPKPVPPRPRPSAGYGYGYGRSAGGVAPVGVELL